MYEEYLHIIEEKAKELDKLSDAIWDNPETAFGEKVSAGLLTDFLQAEGFTVTMPYCGIDTAFCASFGQGKPVIGLLGAFDALAGLSQVAEAKKEYDKRMQEETYVPIPAGVMPRSISSLS